jgi:hypothetical protein
MTHKSLLEGQTATIIRPTTISARTWGRRRRRRLTVINVNVPRDGFVLAAITPEKSSSLNLTFRLLAAANHSILLTHIVGKRVFDEPILVAGLREIVSVLWLCNWRSTFYCRA